MTVGKWGHLCVAGSGQSGLAGFEPAVADRFRFTWQSTREGAAVSIEYRGGWRWGVIVHRGREYASVMLIDRERRTVYVRREYGALRRRVVKPRLFVIAKL